MRRLPRLLAAAAALLLPQVAAANPPDIILFLADDLGSADIGPVRRELKVATPSIDAIGASGITFTSGYAQPACVQSRTALMAGKWPQRRSVGAVVNNGPQPPTTMVTLAERLRALGYATHLVGKWHLGFTNGQHPLDQGFDTFLGFKGVTPDYVGHDPDAPLFRDRARIRNTGLVTDTLAAEAVALLRAPRDRPMFLFVSWTAPHDPLQATLAQRVAEMDAAMGRILAVAGPDTLILFAGDNGRGANNSPLRGKKYDILEGGVRVPFALSWAGHVAPGQVVATPAALVDIAATAIAAAGGEFLDSDGFNLLALPADRPVFFQALRGQPGFAVRKGQWKLYLDYQGAAVALYDVLADRGELANIAGMHPDIVDQLRLEIAAFRAALAD